MPGDVIVFLSPCISGTRARPRTGTHAFHLQSLTCMYVMHNHQQGKNPYVQLRQDELRSPQLSDENVTWQVFLRGR